MLINISKKNIYEKWIFCSMKGWIYTFIRTKCRRAKKISLPLKIVIFQLENRLLEFDYSPFYNINHNIYENTKL